MVSKTNIRNYKSKKYASRLKNKKRTKMSGGSIRSVPINNTRTSFTLKLPSNTEKNKIKELKKIEVRIRQSLITINEQMRLQNFELFEVTSSFIQFRYFYDVNNIPQVPLYFTINTDELSVDILQYFINNNKVIVTANNYISINENTIKLKGYKTSGQKRTGGGYEYKNKFINVYEELHNPRMIIYEDNLKNLGYNELLNKGHIFEINLKNLSNNKLCKLAEDVSWLKEITNDLNSILQTNTYTGKKIDYFLKLYKAQNNKSKVKTDLDLITKDTKLFTCIDLNVDHTKLIIDDGGEDADNNKLLINGEEYVIIGYPAEKMRTYLDLYNKHQAKFNTIYNEHKTEFMKYMAQLHNYIYDNLDNPDPLKQINTETVNLTREICKFYGYESYYAYMEYFYEIELLKGVTPEEKKKFKKNEAHKNAAHKNVEYHMQYDPKFQEKFKELQKKFYNELASKCLTKPMMKINYVFLIFKKHIDGNYVPALFNFRELKHKHHPILERLEYLIKSRLSKIYNIIADESKEDYKLWYSHYNYGDVFHIKTEYVHTMSNIQQQAYKYKNSISLEELIYMLSIPNVDLINLRLDYQRKPINFSKIDDNDNPEYHRIKNEGLPQIGIYELKPKIIVEEDIQLDEELNKFVLPENKILLIFAEIGKTYTIIYKSIADNKIYKLKIKLDLISCIQNIFDYLVENECEKFKEVKISLLALNDMEYIKSIDITKNIKLYKVIEHKLLSLKDYKGIMRYNPLLVRKIKKIPNMPTISKDNNNNSKLIIKTISSDVFFQSPLVNITQYDNYDMLMPNYYLKKPFIIRNFLATDLYKREFKEFKKLIVKNNNNSKISYNYPLKNLYDINCSKESLTDEQDDVKYFIALYEFAENKRQFNRIFFNPGNCRYNFIEMCEKSKRVVWIVPLNATYNEEFEEANKTEFNDSEINYVPIYLGHFTHLTINHINMLEQLNKLFNNEIYESFFNIGSILPAQFSLHAHVFTRNETYYTNPIAPLQQGSRIDKFLNTKTVLNLLNLSKKYNYEYYNNYDCELLIHDKA